MGQRMDLDMAGLSQAVDALRVQAETVEMGRYEIGRSDISTFSTVSGFRNVGLRLGHISDFYSNEALDAFTNHLLDVAGVVEANLANVVGADDSLAGVFSRLGSVVAVGGPGPEYASRMGEAAAEAKAVNATASDFIPPSPMVGTQRDLVRLHHKLAASNIAATAEDAAYWRALAARITETVEALYGVKSALASSLETRWVRRGDERLNRIQRAGGVYAMHAEAMAGHVEALGTTAAAEQVMAAAAVATAAATTDPAAKAAFEQQYLAAFPKRATASLATTVPEFTKLLPDLAHVSGARYAPDEVSSPQAPVFAHAPLPSGVRDALTAQGYSELAHARTPGEVVSQFGQVTPDGLEAIAAGATPTQVASAAAPTMPPSLTPGATNTTPAAHTPHTPSGAPAGGVIPAASVGTPGARAAGSRAGSTKLNLPHTPTTPHAPNTPHAPGGAGGGGGRRHGATHRGTTGGDTTAGVVGTPRTSQHTGSGGSRGGSTIHTPHAGAHSTGTTPHAPGAGRTSSGVTTGTPLGTTQPTPGAGSGSHAGGSHAGGSHAGGSHGGGSGQGGHAGSGTTSGGSTPGAGAGGNTAGASSQQRAMAFGGAPMGIGGAGAGGRGQSEKKPGKVKAVTSAVEREGNLRALLGDAPLVLPPVIGHNVRN